MFNGDTMKICIRKGCKNGNDQEATIRGKLPNAIIHNSKFTILKKLKIMPQFLTLGTQVLFVVLVGCYHNGNILHYF